MMHNQIQNILYRYLYLIAFLGEIIKFLLIELVEKFIIRSVGCEIVMGLNIDDNTFRVAESPIIHVRKHCFQTKL